MASLSIGRRSTLLPRHVSSPRISLSLAAENAEKTRDMGRRALPSILITLFLATLPYLLLSVENKRVALYDLAFAAPYLILILVGFLGEKLNQRRILFTAIAIGICGAYLCLELPDWLGPHARGLKGQIVSVALPAMLYLAFSFEESKLRGQNGLILLGLALAPLLVSHLLPLNARGELLFTTRIQTGFFFGHLPVLGVLSGLAFAFLGAGTEDRYLKVFRIYVAISLIPLFFALERTGARFRSAQQFQLEMSLALISAAAILVYANFFLYWQKVYLDELTGVPNRRALDERLTLLRHHYTLAMVDIDHFKRFNDTYGHEQGDSVLRFVASQLSKGTGAQVYRYGGEEFCMVFENSSARAAEIEMESLRERLAQRDFFIRASRVGRTGSSKRDRRSGPGRASKVNVTISVGIAEPSVRTQPPEDVIQIADEALYKAKQRGRNRVVAA
jgi:diguanylate cyclase (GGDEF)-like protein